MGINKVCISGNLTADAKLRRSAAGNPRLVFSVAVNRSVRRDDGTWGEDVDFIYCTVFGRRAEGLEPYMKKGGKVAVSGRLSQRSWTDEEGRVQHMTSVVADEVELMQRRGQVVEAEPAPGMDVDSVMASAVEVGRSAYSTDDIPF